jgi:hypothetical protein
MHHRIEGPLGDCAIRIGERADAPLVSAPAALTLFPSVADDGVPVEVRFLTVTDVGIHLDRKGR